MSNDLKNIIDYDKNGFIINGKREFLIGGEFHYFRVPADKPLKNSTAMGAAPAQSFAPNFENVGDEEDLPF